MHLFIIVLVVTGIVWWAWKVADYYSENDPLDSGCTGDCEQGRYCNCTGDTPTTNSNWPFPKDRP